LIFDVVPAYFAAWLLALGICLAVGVKLALRSGFPAGRSGIAILILAASVVLGSKLLYCIEGRLFPFDDYVPARLRGSLHGFRIPGGIAMLALTLPLACRAVGLPWREFGDSLVPLPALGLIVIRLGCFLNGCCFGRVSSLPWAIRFPRGSWVFWYHTTRGWLLPDARASLPVHPLQLYFLGAALVTLAILLRESPRPQPPGKLQLLFYVLFFSTSTLLEPFRQNYLTLNNIVVRTATLIAAGVLVGGRIHGSVRLPSVQDAKT
jgi:phosphatidylglycerol:prolipoprotein diacylglycerol transferase